jgi:hypothetical protein
VIGLRHCGDVVRGVVEICSIWRGRFSLMIPRIESIHGLEDFDFTEMPWRDMIQIVSSVLSGISAWGSRRGEHSLSMVIRRL